MNRETDSVAEFTIAEQESPTLIAKHTADTTEDTTDAPYGPNTTRLEVSSTNTQPNTYNTTSTEATNTRSRNTNEISLPSLPLKAKRERRGWSMPTRWAQAAVLFFATISPVAVPSVLDGVQKAFAESKPKVEALKAPDVLPSIETQTLTSYILKGFVMSGPDGGFGIISPEQNKKYLAEISLTPEGFKAEATQSLSYTPWAMAGSETDKDIKVLGGFAGDLTLFKADGSRVDLKTNYTIRAIQIEPGDKYAIIYREFGAQKLDLNTGILTDHKVDNLNGRIITKATKIQTSDSGQRYSYALYDDKLVKLTHENTRIVIQDLVNPNGIRFDVMKSFVLNGKTIIWVRGNDDMVHQFIDGIRDLSFGPDKSKYPGYYSVMPTGYAMNPITNKAYLAVSAAFPDGNIKSNVEEIDATAPQDLSKRKLVAPETFPTSMITTGINVLQSGTKQELIVSVEQNYNATTTENTKPGIFRVIGNLWQPEAIQVIINNPDSTSKVVLIPAVQTKHIPK